MEKLLKEIRACRLCEPHLPLGPRPIIRARESARILIIGQAPGTRVHDSGIPWNDPSGNRLRDWLGLDEALFYDDSRIAIMPMGFCYPGRLGQGGDAPPRPECAPTWHARILEMLPAVELTLLVGQYAQKYYLGKRRGRTLTETVANWREFWPEILPTPHPSWRSANWLKKNPWFEKEILPYLRKRVRELLSV